MNSVDSELSRSVKPCACALMRLVRVCFRRRPALLSGSSRLPSQDWSAHQCGTVVYVFTPVNKTLKRQLHRCLK